VDMIMGNRGEKSIDEDFVLDEPRPVMEKF
jgi:hypothetical protein